jgi:hypothetical protein
MPQHDDVWTLTKYLLYDFDREQLARSTLFASYDEAAHAATGLANVMIVPLALSSSVPVDLSTDENPLLGEF